MKNRIFSFLLILLATVFSLNGQSTQKKVNPLGSWKFDAPTAEPGYSTGVITIGLAEKKHIATISFTGSDYKIPGENVKFSGDSLSFSVTIENEAIMILMRLESDKKMAGKAVTSSHDEIPLTATREAAAAK